MPSKRTDIASDFDAAWKKFHEAYTPEKLPRGAITTSQYATINGVSVAAAHSELLRGVRERRLKTGAFRILVNGKVLKVRHYWP